MLSSCAIPQTSNELTIIYEDNVACIAQARGECIKRDRTKYNRKFSIPTSYKNLDKLMWSRYDIQKNLVYLLAKT